jgi:hypothetical protein
VTRLNPPHPTVQPLLVPAARARVELASWVDPLALEGLDGYSHCWVFYLFHANTDTLSMLDATQGPPQQGSTYRSKVRPACAQSRWSSGPTVSDPARLHEGGCRCGCRGWTARRWACWPPARRIGPCRWACRSSGWW